LQREERRGRGGARSEGSGGAVGDGTGVLVAVGGVTLSRGVVTFAEDMMAVRQTAFVVQDLLRWMVEKI